MTIDKLKELISRYPADMKFSLWVGPTRYGRQICLQLRPQYGLRSEIIYMPARRNRLGMLSEEQVASLHRSCQTQLLKHQRMLKQLGCLLEDQGVQP